jgi:hypothetical protein
MSSSSSMSFVDPSGGSINSPTVRTTIHNLPVDDQGNLIWTVWVFNESAFNSVPTGGKSKKSITSYDLLYLDITKCPTRHISKL